MLQHACQDRLVVTFLLVLQERAAAYVANIKQSSDCWQLCVERFRSSAYPEVKFWCLQTLQEVRQYQTSMRQLPMHAAAMPPRAVGGIVKGCRVLVGMVCAPAVTCVLSACHVVHTLLLLLLPCRSSMHATSSWMQGHSRR